MVELLYFEFMQNIFWHSFEDHISQKGYQDPHSHMPEVGCIMDSMEGLVTAETEASRDWAYIIEFLIDNLHLLEAQW